MKTPAQPWFGISHALIVSRVMNGLRRSHSQARPKLITWLAASAFVTSRASAQARLALHSSLVRWPLPSKLSEMGGWWSMFPLLRRQEEPQFCPCWMSHVACFLLRKKSRKPLRPIIYYFKKVLMLTVWKCRKTFPGCHLCAWVTVL